MSDSGRTQLKRFAVLVKSNADVEAGAMPTEHDLTAMTRFNDELVESGAMLAGEGFLASVNGARLIYSDGGVSVQSGPFEDPESLVAGFWIIQAGSLSDAIDLMKRAPMGGGTLEIRQVADAEDFGKELTPELRDREERQRSKMEENARRRAA
jgi:glutathione S-transferase